MKTKIKNKSDFEKILTFLLTFNDFEDERKDAITNISKDLKIKGFRPGKIPAAIVEREVGEDYINKNAIELALPKLMSETLQNEDLHPAVMPSIMKIEQKKDNYEVEILVTLWPEIKKVPEVDMRIEVLDIEPVEDEIEEQLERVRSQFAEVEIVERGADTGDFVTVNITVSRNNTELEGLSVQDHMYEVGSENFSDQLDAKLVGSKAGAIIKFSSIPLAEGEEQEADFSVLVKDVRQKKLPELTDKWAKDILDIESVSELENELRTNVLLQNKQKAVVDYQNKLIARMIEGLGDVLPEQLVLAEMDSILKRFLLELQQSNISVEDYFKMTGLNEESLKEDLNNQASRNLKMVLILDKIVEDNQITLEEKDEKEIDQHLSTHDKSEDPEEIKKHKLNLENEQIRNKALIYLMDQGIPIDSKGEEVYLKDVYTQDISIREEE